MSDEIDAAARERSSSWHKEETLSRAKYTITPPGDGRSFAMCGGKAAAVHVVELSLLSPISRRSLCVLCHQLMRRPRHVTCCSSLYCSGCVERLVASRGKCVADKCRAEGNLSSTGEEDEDLAREIRRARVYCPERKSGCRWAGSLEELEVIHWTTLVASPEVDRHDGEGVSVLRCKYQQLKCPNLCGQEVPLGDLQEHCQTSCPKKLISCEHCGERGSASHMASLHHLRCKVFPQLCPINLNTSNLKTMPVLGYWKAPTKLVERDCPLGEVSCEYLSYGCKFRGQADEVVEHGSKFVEEHLKLACEKLHVLAKENEDLWRRNRELSSQLKVLGGVSVERCGLGVLPPPLMPRRECKSTSKEGLESCCLPPIRREGSAPDSSKRKSVSVSNQHLEGRVTLEEEEVLRISKSPAPRSGLDCGSIDRRAEAPENIQATGIPTWSSQALKAVRMEIKTQKSAVNSDGPYHKPPTTPVAVKTGEEKLPPAKEKLIYSESSHGVGMASGGKKWEQSNDSSGKPLPVVKRKPDLKVVATKGLPKASDSNLGLKMSAARPCTSKPKVRPKPVITRRASSDSSSRPTADKVGGNVHDDSLPNTGTSCAPATLKTVGASKSRSSLPPKSSSLADPAFLNLLDSKLRC